MKQTRAGVLSQRIFNAGFSAFSLHSPTVIKLASPCCKQNLLAQTATVATSCVPHFSRETSSATCSPMCHDCQQMLAQSVSWSVCIERAIIGPTPGDS